MKKKSENFTAEKINPPNPFTNLSEEEKLSIKLNSEYESITLEDVRKELKEKPKKN